MRQVPVDSGRPPRIRHLAAFRHRDYRATWTAYMISGCALWTMIVANSWLVLDKSDSSGWVGIITFASMLPYLVVSPIGGLMADTFDRRSLAQVTFVASTVISVVLAVLAVTGVVELWHVAVLVFLSGCLRTIQEPTIQALVPNQVPREDLLNAITLSSATRHGARFLGLLVAAPLLAIDIVGVGGVLIMSAGFNLIGAFVMSTVGTVSRGRRRPGDNMMSSVIEGLAYIYSHKMIALFIIITVFHCALAMSFESVFPIFTRDELGAVDGSTLGYLVMGFGIGALAGTVTIAGIRSDRSKGQLLFLTGIGSGLTPLLMAVTFNVPMAAAAAVAMGSTQATFMALANTYVQTLAPDRIRGRISSLYILHAGGVMAFGNLGFGFIADALSAPPILVVTGILFVAFMLVSGVGQAGLRRVYRTGEVAAVA